MRRIALALSSVVALSAAFFAMGSPAFAMRVTPVDDGSSANPSPLAHHAAALRAWQLALIVIAGLVVVGAVTAGAALIRASRRTTPTPAAS
jgi:hypothetical protein